MVSKNNFKNKMEQTAARTPHYGIRKLSVGVASVLISTTLYMGATTAKADTLPSTATDTATTKPETASSSSSTQDNTTVDKTVETTTGVANNSTDTSVSATPNAQASTTTTQTNTNNDTIQSNTVNSTRPYQDQQKQVERWNQNPASKPTEKWKYESQSGPYYQQQTKQQETNADNHQIPSEIYSYSISAIDTHNNNRPVVSTTVSGTTGQQVPTNVKLPDGYTVEGSVPDSYTFKADGNSDITIHLKHNTVIVIPEKPKTTEDKLPNNPSKSYPKGVAENDLNKTVVRTIKVTIPDGKTTTTKQTVKLNRVAVVDEVTGEVTYSDWIIGKWNGYSVPEVLGYTATQSKVDEVKVTSDTQNSEVNITYTANKQSTTVKYVDRDGKVVHETQISGKTDETVNVPNELPNGWKLIDESSLPKTITFGSNGNVTITVQISHATIDIQPNQSKTSTDKMPNGENYPDGVSENDLNKTVTRTIKITDFQGKVTTETQTVHLTRTATVDEVTKEVTYSDWSTGKWDNYKIPVIEGYDSNVDQVDGQEVAFDTKNQTVEVSYTKLADPDRSTTPVKEENNTETPKQSQDKVRSKFVDTELPQTGEKNNGKVSAFGAIIASLAAGLGLVGIRRKKDKN